MQWLLLNRSLLKVTGFYGVKLASVLIIIISFSNISTGGLCVDVCSNSQKCRKLGDFYSCLCKQGKKGPNCEDTGTCTATLIMSQLSQLPDYLPWSFTFFTCYLHVIKAGSINTAFLLVHTPFKLWFCLLFSRMWFNFILSFNFIFPLFLGMVLYDSGLKQRKYNVNQGYKINPQHFRTRVLLCQQVLRLDLRLSYGIGFALIAYTLLYYYLLIFLWIFSIVTSQNHSWTPWKSASHFLSNISLYMTTLRLTKPKTLLTKLWML